MGFAIAGVILLVVCLGFKFAGTLNYERQKSAVTNTTGMVVTIDVGEKPDAPGAIGGTGNTGELDARFNADADESGGADIQELFKLEALPIIGSDGAISLQLTVTPKKGDATDGVAQVFTATHPELMDAWQTAAGRARQP